MSSTHKPSRKAVNPNAFYPTPGWCTRALLRSCTLPYTDTTTWLEPCAGDGAIIYETQNYQSAIWNKDYPIPLPRPHWTAIELNPSYESSLRSLCSDVEIGDAFKVVPERSERWDVAITNPPFHRAEELYSLLRPRTKNLCLLLRLDFLGSVRRSSWMQNDVPDVFVLTPRPSFTGTGNDSNEYAWFVWRQDPPTRFGQVRILTRGSL